MASSCAALVEERAAAKGLDVVVEADEIVAVTANVLPDQVAHCLAAGMAFHLGKPISPAKLLETVARWAGRTHRG